MKRLPCSSTGVFAVWSREFDLLKVRLQTQNELRSVSGKQALPLFYYCVQQNWKKLRASTKLLLKDGRRTRDRTKWNGLVFREETSNPVPPKSTSTGAKRLGPLAMDSWLEAFESMHGGQDLQDGGTTRLFRRLECVYGTTG